MDFEDRFGELRCLIEEFNIRVRLGIHDRAAYLAQEIATELVILYDQELEGRNEQSLGDKKFENEEWQILEAVLSKLHEISLVASAYNDVADFVRLKVSISALFDMCRPVELLTLDAIACRIWSTFVKSLVYVFRLAKTQAQKLVIMP